MALLGALKVPGESISVRVREWLGRDYVRTALASAGLVFAEEFTSNFVANLTGLTGWKRSVVKNGMRLAISGLYYFAIPDKSIALVSSMVPIVTMIGEGIAYLVGGAAEHYASMAASYVARRFRAFGARMGGPSKLTTTTATIRVYEVPTRVAVTEATPTESAKAEEAALGGAL